MAISLSRRIAPADFVPEVDTSPRGDWITVNSHSLYVEQHGPPEGESLVLLHHGLGSTCSWKRQNPSFADEGWRVTAYDRWGYGRSEPRAAFESDFLSDEVDSCITLLDALEIESTHLIGHSDGATIALELASRFPDRVGIVITVAAHIYFEPKMLEGLRCLDSTAGKPPRITMLQREHGARAVSLVDVLISHWIESDIENFSILEELPGISSTVLVIQGELDEYATPQHARDIAGHVQDGKLWIIPGVRHMPPYEIPDEFNRRAINFLKG